MSELYFLMDIGFVYRTYGLTYLSVSFFIFILRTLASSFGGSKEGHAEAMYTCQIRPIALQTLSHPLPWDYTFRSAIIGYMRINSSRQSNLSTFNSIFLIDVISLIGYR